MILMVPSVQMDIVGIKQQEGKQDKQDLQRVFPTIHKVSIKNVRFLRGGQSILDRLRYNVNVVCQD